MEQQPKQVVVVAAQKSMGVAIILSVLFGPLGLLYATVRGGLIMMGVGFVVALVTLGIGLPLVWLGAVIWSAVATKSYNEKLISGLQQ